MPEECVPGGGVQWLPSTIDGYAAGVYAAGNPYFQYLFGTADVALQTLVVWSRRKSSEVFYQGSRLLLNGQELLGGYIVLRGQDLRKCRTADLIALMRT